MYRCAPLPKVANAFNSSSAAAPQDPGRLIFVTSTSLPLQFRDAVMAGRRSGVGDARHSSKVIFLTLEREFGPSRVRAADTQRTPAVKPGPPPARRSLLPPQRPPPSKAACFATGA